jgi:amidophosphoribosyltransferase
MMLLTGYKPTDNLVIIDDSIVRGTIKMSIIKMMDRLNQRL